MQTLKCLPSKSHNTECNDNGVSLLMKVVELFHAYNNNLSPLTFPLVPRCLLPPLLL